MDAIRHHQILFRHVKASFCDCVLFFIGSNMKQLSKHTDKQEQTETKISETTVLTKCVSGDAF